MAYGVSNVVRGSTVVCPSDSLASCFYFLLFLMCHYAVMLSPWGQSGLEAKSLSSASASASKRLFPISGPLEPSLYLYRFWRWSLGILQLVEKGHYIFRGGPDLKSDGGHRAVALRHCIVKFKLSCKFPLKPLLTQEWYCTMRSHCRGDAEWQAYWYWQACWYWCTTCEMSTRSF